jgi:hypothetical protein
LVRNVFRLAVVASAISWAKTILRIRNGLRSCQNSFDKVLHFGEISRIQPLKEERLSKRTLEARASGAL